MGLVKTASRADEAKKAWGMAISKTDAHARRCNLCFRPAMHPGTAKATGIRYNVSYEHASACKVANALWAVEREAMMAYLAAGGTLPANQT